MSQSQATLCYIVQDGRVLLIHKKRGIGTGKINGPGGKVEDGESPLTAAVRETREEIGVTPQDPQLRGELWFRFGTGHISHCFVFIATGFTGTLCETPEALPEWFDETALPFDRMWEDDRYWLPLLLAGKHFHGTVKIDDEHASVPVLTVIK